MPTHLETLKELDDRLRVRRKTTDLFERYYAGNHRLAYATTKFEDAFGSLFGAFADNWCSVIADIPTERLGVEGLKIEGAADSEGAKAAWKLWQENDMELHSKVAMLGAIKTGHSYVLVDNTGASPSINVWPSSMAIVKRDPRTHKPIAGLVEWQNDDGSLGAEVYLPEGSQRFKTKKVDAGKLPVSAGNSSSQPEPMPREWQADGEPVETDGRIPLVELSNRPNEAGIGRSDLADVLALQDAINKLANDMIVASEFSAFRQRVLTGIEIPKNPETGEPLPTQQLEAAISRLWSFESPDAKVYDLNPTDLANYVAGIKELLNHLAAQTRTPPHYLLGQMANLSGEALAAAESGLVSRVEAKQIGFGIGWRQVLELAGVSGMAEVVWKNPERVSLSAAADAANKLALPALGITREWIWAKVLGMSPLEVEEMKKSAIAVNTAVDGTGGASSTSPAPGDTPPAPPAPPPA
jgi:hypothetical protein